MRADLLIIIFKCDFFAASPQSEARLLTPPHMLMFGSIATPQQVLINDLAPPGSFFSKVDFMPEAAMTPLLLALEIYAVLGIEKRGLGPKPPMAERGHAKHYTAKAGG